MSLRIKRVELLSIADIKSYPVWEFTNDDEKLEGMGIRPVQKIPVKDLFGKIVGTQVQLSNGSKIWALIENVDTNNPRSTQHFLSLSVFKDKHWFILARYHDFDTNKRGPKAFAKFLGLSVDEVFPITYNISRFCIGKSTALVGTIEKEPRKKLTRAQLIALAVP
ncbi:MAG: hypothetical protein WBM07_18295 [Chitinivibrionales bacterium]